MEFRCGGKGRPGQRVVRGSAGRAAVGIPGGRGRGCAGRGVCPWKGLSGPRVRSPEAAVSRAGVGARGAVSGKGSAVPVRGQRRRCHVPGGKPWRGRGGPCPGEGRVWCGSPREMVSGEREPCPGTGARDPESGRVPVVPTRSHFALCGYREPGAWLERPPPVLVRAAGSGRGSQAKPAHPPGPSATRGGSPRSALAKPPAHPAAPLPSWVLLREAEPQRSPEAVSSARASPLLQVPPPAWVRWELQPSRGIWSGAPCSIAVVVGEQSRWHLPLLPALGCRSHAVPPLCRQSGSTGRGPCSLSPFLLLGFFNGDDKRVVPHTWLVLLCLG